jgi:uncharacterized membrane protein (DUF2068 family)
MSAGPPPLISPTSPEARARHIVRLIASLKLFKALVLLLLAVGALSLLQPDVANAAARLVHGARVDPYDRRLHGALHRILGVSHRRLEEVSLGTFIYAAVFATEGIALWFDRPWAEWLTAIVTASFLPFELYELVVHLSLVRVVALSVNVTVVAWLALRIRSRPRARPLI